MTLIGPTQAQRTIILMKHSMTIRMGAARWDATIHSKDGSSDTFDFRKMDRPARSKWYGAFMSSVRQMINGPTPQPTRRRRRKGAR